jgi:hypothetical protein
MVQGIPLRRAMGPEANWGGFLFLGENKLENEPRKTVLWRGLWLPEWRGDNRSEGHHSEGGG